MRYLLLIITMLIIISPVFSKEYTFDEDFYTKFRQNYARVTVPKGTIIYSKLIDNINSKTNNENDIITTIIDKDWKCDGKLVAPEGSKVIGKITGIKNAAYGSQHATIKIIFTEIIRPDNTLVKINAKPVILTMGDTIIVGAGKVITQGALQGGRITTSPTRLATSMLTGILTKGFYFVTKKGREIVIPENTQFKIELKKNLVTLDYLK